MDSVKDIVLDQYIMEPTATPPNPFYARIGSGIIENIVADVQSDKLLSYAPAVPISQMPGPYVFVSYCHRF